MNAKNNAREADIIAKAGAKGAVTIATNMAGRGTDIKLGEGVAELGGLCVIGTERHESRRIDNQLRGRSGRQGDPGFTQFYLSFEDDLMVRFGSDKYKGMLANLGFTGEQVVQNKMLAGAFESAQRKVEGNNFDIRKQLLQYDDVMNNQREIIYSKRNEILENDSIHESTLNLLRDHVSDVVNDHLIESNKLEDKDYDEILETVNENLLKNHRIAISEIKGKSASEVIQIIRASQTPNDAVNALMERFQLTDVQARAIVEMRLRQLTGLQQEQLHSEYEDIQKKIAYYEQILSDEHLCRKVIKDELVEVKEKYGDPRRSEIVYSSEEFNPEDFYADDQMIITISHLGYIKRTPLSEFHAQNRGGVGSKGTDTRDEDFVEHIYPATMHNTMMFFTQKGKCYWLKVYEIPEGTKNSKGRAIQNLLNIDTDDAVNAYLRVKNLNDQDFINSHYVLFCTKNGVIKKTLLEQYSRPRQNGVNAITIREDDRVIEVRMTNGNNEIIIANRNGRAIRFHESTVRVMGRTATGVRGITLDEDGQDEVVGMICIKDAATETIMVVSEQGYGKRSELEDYRITNRGGKGVKTMNITDKTGKLVAIKSVTDDNDLMIINKSGITIRLKVADVRVMGRATQGVRLINLEKRNDEIGSVCKVTSETAEEALENEGNVNEADNENNE